MKLMRYNVGQHVRTPVGAKVSVDRSGIGLSAGIRGRRGVFLWIPLESESHWLRRHARGHAAMVARVLP